MSDDAGPRVRFCDEYEHLMAEFLRALSAWTQLRYFQQTPEPSNVVAFVTQDAAPDPTAALAETELARSCGNYIAAMWALRMHSRLCSLCEETLRVHVNGNELPPARVSPNCC